MSRKEEIKQMIREVVAKHLPDKSYHLFIFGSQANRASLIKSDIDVGIDAGERIDPATMGKIHAELEELPTLYFFDFVDFQHIRESFKEVAIKNIETL